MNYYPTGYQYPTYQQNQGLIWVQGESAAKSYPIAPNTSVPLWDSEANIIYIKSADASGMPSLKVLDYTMRNTTPKSPDIQPQTSFATKDELLLLKGEIESLKAEIGRRNERSESDGE